MASAQCGLEPAAGFPHFLDERCKLIGFGEPQFFAADACPFHFLHPRRIVVTSARIDRDVEDPPQNGKCPVGVQ